MNVTESVMSALKTKVASLGFTKQELKGVAAVIANNLALDENAEEDVVNAAVDKAVNTMIPILQLAQSQANRSIEKFKTEQEAKNAKKQKATTPDSDTDDDDDEMDDSEGNDLSRRQPTPSKVRTKTTATNKQQNTPPDWATALMAKMDALNNEVNRLQAEKQTNTRRQRLENVLKDTGTFGQQMLKNFAKMTFENDDDFDDYVSEVETSAKDFKTEQSNANLKSLSKHPNVGKEGGGSKELTASEIDSIVAAM